MCGGGDIEPDTTIEREGEKGNARIMLRMQSYSGFFLP
jgi:hypothetical protein